MFMLAWPNHHVEATLATTTGLEWMKQQENLGKTVRLCPFLRKTKAHWWFHVRNQPTTTFIPKLNQKHHEQVTSKCKRNVIRKFALET